MNELKQDRLYELLPTVYRMRDAEQGEPLKALLRVISEQVNLVEDDISQLYENWFIETCEDWVVPYIGDLIGYELVHEAGEPSAVDSLQGRQRNKILIPRREVANTIRYRRRKGSLALLELLANDVAGWPARAVEFYKLVAGTQALNHLHLDRGRTVDLRHGSQLALLDTPFDAIAHSIDVRRINSCHSRGYYNLSSVGLFVWRMRTYSVTRAPAYCLDEKGGHCFSFSILSNDAPLYLNPQPESDPTHIAEELNLPVPIRRRLFEEQLEQIYGEGKSLHLSVGVKRGAKIEEKPVPVSCIVSADLSDWRYDIPKGKVAIDPVLGRIAFPKRECPSGVRVSYHYGFSTDLGGGEYPRPISQMAKATIYRVNQTSTSENNDLYSTLREALQQWHSDAPAHAVIEITDSGIYSETVAIEFKKEGQTLQLRAANRNRPVIRLADYLVGSVDALVVEGYANNVFTLDGLLVTGRSMRVLGDIVELNIRHTTLVPGWALECDCNCARAADPSLEIYSRNICVKIERSILGTIQLDPDIHRPYQIDEAHCDKDEIEPRLDPVRICISDSIVDATRPDYEAIGAPGCPVAHVVLNIQRSTIFGQVQVHAIELGENTIFDGVVTVARRQIGCLRFSYVTEESRTPRRYRCQPDLVKSTQADDTDKQREAARVKPEFNSVRYGKPGYAQLANHCAEEIKRGADDESEMGVYHHLFQPQRMANLCQRADEYLPARAEVGVTVSD